MKSTQEGKKAKGGIKQEKYDDDQDKGNDDDEEDDDDDNDKKKTSSKPDVKLDKNKKTKVLQFILRIHQIGTLEQRQC